MCRRKWGEVTRWWNPWLGMAMEIFGWEVTFLNASAQKARQLLQSSKAWDAMGSRGLSWCLRLCPLGHRAVDSRHPFFKDSTFHRLQVLWPAHPPGWGSRASVFPQVTNCHLALPSRGQPHGNVLLLPVHRPLCL